MAALAPKQKQVLKSALAVGEEEDDEHGAKEAVLQKYFLQEWKLVKSILDGIVSNGRVSDPSAPRKIRAIVTLLNSLLICMLHLQEWIFSCYPFGILVKFFFLFLGSKTMRLNLAFQSTLLLKLAHLGL